MIHLEYGKQALATAVRCRLVVFLLFKIELVRALLSFFLELVELNVYHLEQWIFLLIATFAYGGVISQLRLFILSGKIDFSQFWLHGRQHFKSNLVLLSLGILVASPWIYLSQLPHNEYVTTLTEAFILLALTSSTFACLACLAFASFFIMERPYGVVRALHKSLSLLRRNYQWAFEIAVTLLVTALSFIIFFSFIDYMHSLTRSVPISLFGALTIKLIRSLISPFAFVVLLSGWMLFFYRLQDQYMKPMDSNLMDMK